MLTVEVKLLNYTFRFRNLSWREEFALKFAPRKNPLRTFLAAALVDVSGVPVKTPEEAMKVFASIPIPVLNRIFVVYRGQLPPNRKFETGSLYGAPDPSMYIKRVVEVEEEIDTASDKVIKEMESKFGKQEIAEAAEIDRKVVAGSKYRGAIRLNPETKS